MVSKKDLKNTIFDPNRESPTYGTFGVKLHVQVGLKVFETEEFILPMSHLKMVFRNLPLVRNIIETSPKDHSFPFQVRGIITAFARVVSSAGESYKTRTAIERATLENEEKEMNKKLQRAKRKEKIEKEIERELTAKTLRRHRPKPTILNEDDNKPQRPRRVSPESEEFKKNKFGEQIEDSWKDFEK